MLRLFCRGLTFCFCMVTLSGVTGAATPAELRGHGGAVRALATNQSGEVLTGSFDTRAIVWDAASGAAKRVLHFHEGSVTAVAFLPDGRVATGGQDGRIAIWREGDRQPERVVQAHAGPVTALAVSPEGEALASSAWDRRARITPLGDGVSVELAGHVDNVNGVAFLPGGRLATASYDGSLRIWNREGRAETVVHTGVSLNAVAADASGAIWAAGADGVLRAFDAEGATRGDVPLSETPLVALALREDLIAAGTVDGMIALVAPGTLAVLRTFEASSAPIWSLAFDTESGAVLVGGADHVVRPWDPETGAFLGRTEEVARVEQLGDSRGAQVFRMCAACHTLDPDDGHRAGPTLHGIFGRSIATAEGYPYSEALRAMDIVWTPETVARLFEIGPSAMTPGTSMPEQRIADPADRAALIEFLQEHTR